jgi:transketolase
VRKYFAQHQRAQAERKEQWKTRWENWRAANADKAAQLQAMVDRRRTGTLVDRIPEFAADYADATRSAGGVVIQSLASELPALITGSADLFGSTKNYIKDGGDFSRDNPSGRNIWFGIREHAMGAVLNGMAYDGLFVATGATFTVFADYMRPSIRLAALARLPVVYILTHDSVGVGEDGPTHQPVETVSGLRVIPGLDVSRPADPEEVAGAFAAAIERTDGPTALLLTRQKVPTLHEIPVAARRSGAARGGYTIVRETAALERILIATGSEVAIAIKAARQLGPGTRVVSMTCCERFDRQSDEYRESVLPASCRKRVAVEAGVTGLWWKYVGDQGRVVGIDRFGLSAPGEVVMSQLGITVDHIVAAAQQH